MVHCWGNRRSLRRAMGSSEVSMSVREYLRAGQVIPAHPLALTASRTLDEARQRGLTRYYIDAGAGGVAVGVHTTQFAIGIRASVFIGRCSSWRWRRHGR